MLSLVAPLFLILAPAVLARGGPASRILIVSGLAWAIVGGVEWALTAAPLAEVLPRMLPQGTALHDTYYVVSHVQVALGTGLTLIVLGALTRSLDGVGWVLVAWVFQTSLVIATHLGTVFFQFISPVMSDTFALATLFERLNTIVTAAAGISIMMSVSTVVGLAGVSR